MPTLTNTNFEAGDTLNVTAINAKYTQATTATTGIDEENVAKESIDVSQLSSTSPFIIRVDTSYTGTTTTGNYVDASAAAEISHGSGTRIAYLGGQSIADGNLIRVKWQLEVNAQDLTVTTAPDDIGTLAYLRGLCYLVWLQWDVTDGTLTNWEAVPGQDDHGALAGGLADGIACSETEATTVIPLAYAYYDSALTSYYAHVYANSTDTDKFSVSGSWNYIDPDGGAVTVYGFRLVIRGIYSGNQTGGASYLECRDAEADIVSSSVTLRRCQMAVIIQESV